MKMMILVACLFGGGLSMVMTGSDWFSAGSNHSGHRMDAGRSPEPVVLDGGTGAVADRAVYETNRGTKENRSDTYPPARIIASVPGKSIGRAPTELKQRPPFPHIDGKGDSLKQRLAPGVYRTFPYMGIVVVPELSEVDKRSIVPPPPGTDSRIRVVPPELSFVPVNKKPNR